MRKWTKDEEDFLKENYPSKWCSYCAKKLNRSYKSVAIKAERLNLKEIGKDFKTIRLGEKHTTNEGYEIEIIEYFNFHNCTIKFDDENETILKNMNYSCVKTGEIKNPYHRSVHGVGFMGLGMYSKPLIKKHRHYYLIWKGILERCYNEKTLKRCPTYKDVTVCEEWHNFQNFAEWFEENWKPWMDNTWHLDKDILAIGNKVYSPETCAFVPQEINNLFKSFTKDNGLPTGVYKSGKKFIITVKNNENKRVFDTPEEAFEMYKILKESDVKKLANKWKKQITELVYNTLIKIEVK
jgi:hypothetical protein